MSRGGIVFLVMVLSLLLLAACDRERGSSPSPRKGPGMPAYGDAVVAGSIGEPSTLIPILATDSASSDISSLVYNGLVRYD